jgi:hypothetical protein
VFVFVFVSFFNTPASATPQHFNASSTNTSASGFDKLVAYDSSGYITCCNCGKVTTAAAAAAAAEAAEAEAAAKHGGSSDGSMISPTAISNSGRSINPVIAAAAE